jgi:hypothetical protein
LIKEGAKPPEISPKNGLFAVDNYRRSPSVKDTKLIILCESGQTIWTLIEKATNIIGTSSTDHVPFM